MQRLTAAIAPPTSSYTSTTITNNSQIVRGSAGLITEKFGSVPSPAPNSNTNLASVVSGGQIAKLTMLSNGNSIVHSTPIGKSYFYI